MGYIVGPGADERTWLKPLVKYEKASAHWASLKLGLAMNIIAHNIYIVTLLEYVAQLQPITERVLVQEL